MSSAKDKLLALERQIDREVSNLPVLQLPVRVILTALHLTLDVLANGSRTGSGLPANAARRDSLLSRISYLVELLKKAPLVPVGASAADALSFYSQHDPDLTQNALLLQYAHFCEEMPKVHKGYLQVQSVEGSHVVLAHATAEFAASETTDILLSELAGSVILSGLSRLDVMFDKLARQSPTFDSRQMELVQEALYQHYRRFVFEIDLLTEAGFVAATGVSREVFHRFRAALFALADFCDGVAGALTRRLNAGGPAADEALANEMLEWVSVCWLEEGVRGLVGRLARTTPAELGKLLPFFLLSLDGTTSQAGQAGDGFTPPLIQLGDSVSFTASLVRAAVAERNILFGLNRLNPSKFANLVAQHLEPKLLSDATSLLQTFPDLVVVPNVVWDRGEIDLLVYSASENAVLHVQAKAPLPPEGARMIRATESRVEEGLAQLATFKGLPQPSQDAIFSRALSRPISNALVVDAVLARTCFGTHRVWAQAAEVSFITLPLLALVLDELARRNEPFSVVKFPGLADELLRNLVTAVMPRWESETIELGTASVAVPMLHYDHSPLLQAKAAIHKVFDQYLG